MREIGMSYECEIVETAPVTSAVTSEILIRSTEIGSRITDMFDAAYWWLSESDLSQAGQNYAVSRNTPEGMHIRVGFPCWKG